MNAQNNIDDAAPKAWLTDATQMRHAMQEIILSRSKSAAANHAAPVAAVLHLQSANARCNLRGFRNSKETGRDSQQIA
ncbi:MAG: hypothetical protein VXV91_08715, partial [Verrucomicrobiota bacterium]|nr:hypothetical protein [Verrucomicrobiota bacterium]